MIQKYVQNLDMKSWIIVAFAIVVMLMILFRPVKYREDPTKRIYWDAIEKLHQENVNKDSVINLLFKASKIREQQVGIIVGAKELEIRALKAKASKAVARIPKEVRETHAEIDSALSAKDAVIDAVEEKADSLQSALNFQVGVVKQLQTLVIDKDKIQNEMYTVCAAQLDKAQRQAEKERKRKTFWRKAAQVLGVAVIVETLLILAE